MKAKLSALAVLALGLWGGMHARAQPHPSVATRALSMAWQSAPVLTFSLRDFVDAPVLKKLQSGLPQTVTTRVYAYAENSREPLTVTALTCRVVYDLWDGTYRIERQTEKTDRTLSAKTTDGVVQQCLEIQNLTLGESAAYQRERGGYIYFGVVVELNPLSQDTVQRIRRWLAQPSGSELEGNAFFGSFVSIFVGRKLGSAEKTLSFRSQLFVVPP